MMEKFDELNACTIANKYLIEDPTNREPSFALPRKIWRVLNCIRTGTWSL